MTCKGICIRHRAQKPVGSGRYVSGQRRCQICEIFIKWEGLWCPCCGYRLRTKPRNLKYKAKLRARSKRLVITQPAITAAKVSCEFHRWMCSTSILRSIPICTSFPYVCQKVRSSDLRMSAQTFPI